MGAATGGRVLVVVEGSSSSSSSNNRQHERPRRFHSTPRGCSKEVQLSTSCWPEEEMVQPGFSKVLPTPHLLSLK